METHKGWDRGLYGGVKVDLKALRNGMGASKVLKWGWGVLGAR